MRGTPNRVTVPNRIRETSVHVLLTLEPTAHDLAIEMRPSDERAIRNVGGNRVSRGPLVTTDEHRSIDKTLYARGVGEWVGLDVDEVGGAVNRRHIRREGSPGSQNNASTVSWVNIGYKSAVVNTFRFGFGVVTESPEDILSAKGGRRTS